ncbi:MAG: hypothetical protein ACHQEB_03315, partial [Chitinophagales bacterium]
MVSTIFTREKTWGSLLAWIVFVFISCSKGGGNNSNNNGGGGGGGGSNPPPTVTNVYVAGIEKNASGKNVAKYWKNGVATSLTDGMYDAWAGRIFISGSDIY